MAEIKRTFASGRMNKDLDERLIPNGEYRDAQNIQVRTTDDGAAGTVQNIKGNREIGSTHTGSGVSLTKCVGSVADEKNNTSYFIFAGADLSKSNPQNISSRTKHQDFILRVDADGRSRNIFIDTYAVKESYTNADSPTAASNWTELDGFFDTSHYKVGMDFFAYNSSGVVVTEPNTYITKVENQKIHVNKTQSNAIPGSGVSSFIAEAPRVLGINQRNLITGINIIDDLLFFTSDQSEPRQINLKSVTEGTLGTYKNTLNKIIVNDDGNLVYNDPITDLNGILLGPELTADDVTVIKKSPKLSPSLSLFDSKDTGGDILVIDSFTDFLTNGVPVAVGSTGIISGIPDYVEYSVGNLLQLTSQANPGDETVSVIIKVTDIEQNQLNYQIIFIDQGIQLENTTWDISNKTASENIFRYKFPRFAFRYKYDNNEYSSFSPWSEIAFMPGGYTLESKDGYNLSMVNRLSKIEIINSFSDDLVISKNVKAIDILYKSTDSPTVYVVKTLERDSSPEWSSKANISITTEMINSIVPDDQILRAWDNVPKTAKAQEMIGNRLVYANFTQGYDVPFKPLLAHNITSTFLNPENNNIVAKSIKSLRTYKLGLVLGDKYGRETPVISLGTRDAGKGELDYSYGYDDGYVSKGLAARSNKLQVCQKWETQENSFTSPEWAEYAKYYIKENSTDYYNLASEAWYEAGDGNIWLAFVSADRNKVDEDTYLILKKSANSNESISLDYRYKILAIENEAPEYIKTREGLPKSMSAFNFANVMYNWIEPGVNQSDNQIAIKAQNYLETDDVSYNGGKKGRLVFNATINSVEYRLSTPYNNILNEQQPIEGGDYVFTFAEKFDDTAHFYQRLVNLGAYADVAAAKQAITGNEASFSSAIQLEVVNLRVINSPEFQGKFFVKINRDSGIQYNVINELADGDVFELVDSFDINYIEARGLQPNSLQTSSLHPATNGSEKDYIWGSTASIPALPTRENFGQCDHAEDTHDWWHQYYNYGKSLAEDGIIDQTAFKAFVGTPRFVNPLFNVITQPQAFGGNGYESTPGFKGSFYLNYFRDGIGNGDTSDETLLNGAFVPTAFAKIQEVGTIFGFQDDPNGYKYVVDRVDAFTRDSHFHFIEDLPGAQGVCVSCSNDYPFTNDPGGGNPGGGGVNPTTTGTNVGTGSRSALESWLSSREGPDDDITDFNTTDPLCRMRSRRISFTRVNSQGVRLPGVGLDTEEFDPTGNVKHDGYGALDDAADSISPKPNPFIRINIYEIGSSQTNYSKIVSATNPAVFETEPKQSTDLELYYEASSAIPQRLDRNTTAYFAPVGCRVSKFEKSDGTTQNLPVPMEVVDTFDSAVKLAAQDNSSSLITNIDVGDTLQFEHSDGTITRAKIGNEGRFLLSESKLSTNGSKANAGAIYTESISWNAGDGTLSVSDGSSITPGMHVTGVNILPGCFVTEVNSNTITISNPPTSGSGGSQSVSFNINNNCIELSPEVYKNKVDLPWFNCYSYGNGVESNRIRDDFNAPTIDNGVKVSSTFTEYKEEQATNRMIFSGIYNANSSTNNLNEFNMARKITKDLNPSHGSIQALKTRDTDLITFTEDKIFRVLANKDALFAADGSSSITSSDRVLGQVIPYVGDYGISKNPESIAQDQFRIYFTDKQRGAVLRLSRDGLTPISNVGMKTYFRDYLAATDKAIGSFDVISGQYNLTLKTNTVFRKPDVTISFSETTKGWVSFKSFIQDDGLSVSGKYLTVKDNKVWSHGSNSSRNNFYSSFSPSSITTIMNDIPSSVKTFKSIGYEGSEGKAVNVNNITVTDVAGNSVKANDGLFDNLSGQPSDGFGWSATISTDSQSGIVDDFRNKENKWFGFIVGDRNEDGKYKSSDIKYEDFTTQGIGTIKAVTARSVARNKVEVTIQN